MDKMTITEALAELKAEDAFRDALWDRFPAGTDEDVIDRIATWAWKQVSNAYGDGYKTGQSDTQQAMQWASEAMKRETK